DARLLPLQQGLSHSSYASEGSFSVVILRITDDADVIRVKAGIFYTGLTPGCSCADDPSPDNTYAEYCEVEFNLDKKTAVTRITPLP
ncbi:MAG: hypothetical protein ABFR19_09585, partial [Pseudomonadota bacterium]